MRTRSVLAIACTLLVSAFLVSGIVPTQGAGPYTFTTIDFPGGHTTHALAINNHGQIVGYFVDRATGGQRGFLLSGGAFTPIDYPGAARTLALGINDAGQIVGAWSDRVTDHGFLLSGGVFTSIDFPGSRSTRAGGINNHGDIVGEYGTGARVGPFGFLLSGGVFTTIDPPGSNNTEIHGINDQRDVVGLFGDPDPRRHAFLFSGGVFTRIDVPGATRTEGTEINDAPARMIVGAYVDGAGRAHGFVLSGGSFTTVDFPGAGVINTGILGINNSGTLVGFYDDATGRHGFVATSSVTVQIDIKPGNFPNPIPDDPDPLNLSAKGVVPVAIFTTGGFDASTVNASTVQFAGAPALRSTLEDVDLDGDLDMVLHFDNLALQLTCADTQAMLTGQTTSGTSIEGVDSIRVLKDKNGNKCP